MPDLSVIGQAAGNGGVLAGRVGGAVLATMRTRIPLTQEDLAERLQVSPTTVQAWERGRKPLINMPFARLQSLRRELDAVGADPGLLRLWDKALHTDVILAALDTPSPWSSPTERQPNCCPGHSAGNCPASSPRRTPTFRSDEGNSPRSRQPCARSRTGQAWTGSDH